jgi:hypothetical protein
MRVPSRLGASTTQADRGDPQLSTTLAGTTPSAVGLAAYPRRGCQPREDPIGSSTTAWPDGDCTRRRLTTPAKGLDAPEGVITMTGVFEAPNEGYVKVPLEEGEQELLRKTAGLIQAGTSSVGGVLVLTSRRLLFRPLKVNKATTLLKEASTSSRTALPRSARWQVRSSTRSTARLGARRAASATRRLPAYAPAQVRPSSVHPPCLSRTVTRWYRLSKAY